MPAATRFYSGDLPLCSATHTHNTSMSSAGAPMVDNDADFVYDYETLRIAGLSIAAVIVVLSILLLTGNRIRRCGKSRPRRVEDGH
ncbi:sodium/potassium-transporting ATPase subunit gamma-like [Astyanax mexicanus]|uniref:FXYD domain-containing ion transport regulator n=1 Tax=Astyanax mexicanus TaxID=7994 RepID=A0A8T2KZB6_ASTMX|nr:sodium/potassium-transporting ATPase subunit gamma-like [Astyanax mexicanus]